jgi:hypothetical protein
VALRSHKCRQCEASGDPLLAPLRGPLRRRCPAHADDSRRWRTPGFRGRRLHLGTGQTAPAHTARIRVLQDRLASHPCRGIRPATFRPPACAAMISSAVARAHWMGRGGVRAMNRDGVRAMSQGGICAMSRDGVRVMNRDGIRVTRTSQGGVRVMSRNGVCVTWASWSGGSWRGWHAAARVADGRLERGVGSAPAGKGGTEAFKLNEKIRPRRGQGEDWLGGRWVIRGPVAHVRPND